MRISGISIYCPWCHRYTFLNVGRGEGEYEDDYRCKSIFENNTGRWWIGECNHCKKCVLVHETIYGRNEIFPSPLPEPTDERIPEHIRNDLDEAKKCFSISAYRACAVMARRAIQNACIDKGCNPDDRLVNQIEELFKKGIITMEMKDWATVVRWVGNDAAHPSNPEVTREDAEDILNLAEQLFHILYVAPAIAEEMRKRKRKS